MRVNAYLVVFLAVVVIIVLAAAVSFLPSSSTAPQAGENLSLASLPDYGPAPPIAGIAAWINSPPLNLSQLRGKVVLVDFWTYSCINCLLEIPYLNAWESEYGSNGLVIIGVSTPEFTFEHNYTNVYDAVQRDGIKYAVALDNNYTTWDNYDNHYWPADYLINASGYVRYVSFGDGNYNTTQRAIQLLLESAGYSVANSLANVTSSVNFSQIDTPEIYLGYGEARQALGGGEVFSPGNIVDYGIPDVTQTNVAYLGGEWYNAEDSMIAVSNATIFLTYKSAYVNIVAEAYNTSNASIVVRLDNNSLPQDYLGSDAHIVDGNAVVDVSSPRLYSIISAPSYGWHTLEIEASPGFRIYTFTFD